MEIIIDGVDFWDSFEPQKYWSFPSSYDVNRKKKEAREMVMSEHFLGACKKDGVWELIIKDNNGNLHARSRVESTNGGYPDKIDWIPQIKEELAFLPNNSVVIGEIYLPNNEGSRNTTSVFNCLKEKCLQRQKDKEPLHYYIFDVLAFNGVSLLNKEFEKRISVLNSLKAPYSFIEFAEYKKGQELWDTYLSILAAGGEGIVIQKDTSTYLCGKKKARESLKMKKELQDTIDAFLDGGYKPATRLYTGKEIENWSFWENLKTKEKFNTCKFDDYVNGDSSVEPITKAYYYGWASSVSFSLIKDGKPKRIGWISGITDQLKEEIVTNPDKWINKVAELNAMQAEFIDGEYSLRHGRIVGWREDKRSEDCPYSQVSDQS